MENKKVYPQKDYYKTFTLKNKDKINQKIICETCLGSYTYFNKAHHIKSKKHLIHNENKNLKQQITAINTN